MSNKLKFSETPIYVSSIEDFQKACEIYQSRQSFTSKCEVCGKEIHFFKGWPCNRPTKLLCPTHKSIYTKIQKYGSLENFEKHRLEKAKETSIKRYGVDNIFKRTDIISAAVEKKYGKGITCGGLIKEAHVKQQQTMLDRYGTTCILTNPEIQEKAKEKARTAERHGHGHRHGTNFNFNRPEVLEKVKERAHTPEANQKRKQTCLQKYGCEVPSQSDKVKQKAAKTCLERWGRMYGGSGHQTHYYFYENIYFDSSWELAYYIYLKDHNIDFSYHTEYLEYEVEGKKHKYEVDFKVEGKLIELKGSHLINSEGHLIDPFKGVSNEQLLAKEECMKQNNVKIFSNEEMKEILNYINTQYGKDFLRKWRHK